MSGHDHHVGPADHLHPALDLPYGLPDWAFQDQERPGRLDAEPTEPAVTTAGADADENDNLGLPTFGNRDWIGTRANLSARRPDVAVVGAPFDINTTNRAGARFGPKYLRSTTYDPGDLSPGPGNRTVRLARRRRQRRRPLSTRTDGTLAPQY